MELYIGGYAQGKLQYVLMNSDTEIPVVSEANQLMKHQSEEKIIFNLFHEWFRREVDKGESPEEKMNGIIGRYDQIVIISNEVGNGIIPLKAKEREYRERLGRYLCQLAGKAERVERIICGIGQRIK